MPDETLMRCAVAKLIAQEMAEARTLVAQCGADATLLAKVPMALCEHLQSLGFLGHTERRASDLHVLCAEIIADAGGAFRDVLLTHGLASDGKLDPEPEADVSVHQRLHAIAVGELPSDACPRALDEPLAGWPTALQLLLDQDGTGLARSLRHPKGGAARALAADLAGSGGAVSALVHLAAARSDTLFLTLLCSLGVCARALRAPPAPAALAAALANASDVPSRSARHAVRLEAATRAFGRRLQLHWDSAGEAGGEADVVEGAAGDSAAHREYGCSPAGDGASEGDDDGGTCPAEHAHEDATRSNGWLSAAHLSAFLLDADALARILRHAPELANAPDAAGRTPLHYLAHGGERRKLAVYLFTEQPFRTWLEDHSASRLRFAPSLTRGTTASSLPLVDLHPLTAW